MTVYVSVTDFRGWRDSGGTRCAPSARRVRLPGICASSFVR
ncbi:MULTISPECIES: hypothetical protein [unclassified Bradyrhizobium]|nr:MULTISPECIES: hypothetical protein [unclassified Bradyrhizobium]